MSCKHIFIVVFMCLYLCSMFIYSFGWNSKYFSPFSTIIFILSIKKRVLSAVWKNGLTIAITNSSRIIQIDSLVYCCCCCYFTHKYVHIQWPKLYYVCLIYYSTFIFFVRILCDFVVFGWHFYTLCVCADDIKIVFYFSTTMHLLVRYFLWIFFLFYAKFCCFLCFNTFIC